MSRQSSSPIFDQRVYAQDNAPADEREGNQWVDTSVDPPEVRVYSTDSNSWEPAAVSNWSVQDNSPGSPKDGDGWIDTSNSPATPRIYEANSDTWERVVPKNTIDDRGVFYYSIGGINESNVSASELEDFAHAGNGREGAFDSSDTGSLPYAVIGFGISHGFKFVDSLTSFSNTRFEIQRYGTGETIAGPFNPNDYAVGDTVYFSNLDNSVISGPVKLQVTRTDSNRAYLAWSLELFFRGGSHLHNI